MYIYKHMCIYTLYIFICIRIILMDGNNFTNFHITQGVKIKLLSRGEFPVKHL